MVIVGSIVPGAMFVIFAGILASKGLYDVGDMIIFASLGAILGDAVSYYLGTRGTRLFKAGNRFLKAELLEKGIKFIGKHGGKSILIGRFVGPLRSILPFVAGLTRMKMGNFMLWNIVGGILWSIAHVLIGYFFGGSLALVHKWSLLVTIFVLGTISVVVILWIFMKQFNLVVRYWKPFIIFLSGFLLYQLADIIFLGEATPLIDMRVHDWFLAVRDEDLTQLFRFITLLGDSVLILPTAIIISMFLYLKKHNKFIIPFWATLIGAGVTTFILKIITARPRPLDALIFENDFSFPSGHATIAVAFYGFLVFMVMRYPRQFIWKNIFVSIGAIIILLIGLSRLYLGVHYLSDVMAGYLVGTMGLLLGIYIHDHYVALCLKLESL